VIQGPRVAVENVGGNPLTVKARLVNGCLRVDERKVKLELVEVTQNNHVILADTYLLIACDMAKRCHTAVDISI
jgi:hypothetical protein